MGSVTRGAFLRSAGAGAAGLASGGWQAEAGTAARLERAAPAPSESCRVLPGFSSPCISPVSYKSAPPPR